MGHHATASVKASQLKPTGERANSAKRQSEPDQPHQARLGWSIASAFLWKCDSDRSGARAAAAAGSVEAALTGQALQSFSATQHSEPRRQHEVAPPQTGRFGG